MSVLELLGNVLTSIEPRNQRARIWLDKLILRCHFQSAVEQNQIAQRAIIEGLHFDFQTFLLMQGKDGKQKELYDQAQHLLAQLRSAAEPTQRP
jgi:cellulose biosynthesis protein BcsQ